MTIPLHPEHVAAVYDCLRALPPFDRMRLPPAEEVEFVVSRASEYYGWHVQRNGTHRITVSSLNVGYFATLAVFVAHEMLHLYQAVAGTSTSGVQHNAEYRKLAAKVCRVLGFDPKLFV